MDKPVMLVPIDVTGCAWEVVHRVEYLATRLEMRVLLLNCVRLPAGVSQHDHLRPGGGAEIEAGEYLDRDAIAQIQPMAAALEAAGVPTRIELRHGEPVDEILAAAVGYGAAHIVMGTHGRKGLRRLLEGSVAEEVIRRAGVPVTVIHALAPGDMPGPTPAMLDVAAEADG